MSIVAADDRSFVEQVYPNFLGLESGSPDSAPAVLLPIPYEATVSYGKGTGAGPRALLEASAYVELYDEVRDRRPADTTSYYTAPPVQFDALHAPAMAEIQRRASALLQPGRCLCALGGEHSITAPLVATHLQQFPQLHVLQIDAHCDLRDRYDNNPFSHASAMARVTDLVGDRLTQVGIRSICAEDRAAIRRLQLSTFFARDLSDRKRSDWIAQVIDSLGPNVYLTVDVDGFDPSVIPSTGTPEPGGLSWWDGVELIRAVGQQRRIVGADITELAVSGDRAVDRIGAFAAAKLAYQILTAALEGQP